MQATATSGTATTSATRYVILVTIGPGEREMERLRDLCDSIAYHEPGPSTILLVDDSATDRRLHEQLTLPEGFRAVSVHHARRHVGYPYKLGKGICSAVLSGVAWIAEHEPATPFALKLDTDSLIVGPFVERLTRLLSADASIGMVGAFRTTPNNTPRDFKPAAAAIERAMTPPKVGLLQRLLGRSPSSSAGTLRRVVERAKAGRFGYEIGEHCMGGGYAISNALLAALRTQGYLKAPMDWETIDIPEDVMLGLHTRAVDMDLRDAVQPGDVFGVRYKGLPCSPEDIVQRGYAVIHAVKNDPTYDEATIRAFFQTRRRPANG